MLVLGNPLGIVREDFDAHFSPDTVRSTHLSDDNIRRLRVLFAS
jgi:hypothetical protein